MGQVLVEAVASLRRPPARARCATGVRRRGGCRDGGSAAYRDARVGDTLEFAGRLWKVAAIGAGDGSPAESNPHSGYVDLELVGPAGG